MEVVWRLAIEPDTEAVPGESCTASSLAVKLLTTPLVQASSMKILRPLAAYNAPDTGTRHVTGHVSWARVTWTGEFRSQLTVASRLNTATVPLTSPTQT